MIPSCPPHQTRTHPTTQDNVFSLYFCDQLWFSLHIHTGNYFLDIFIWTLQKHLGPKQSKDKLMSSSVVLMTVK